ncbi:hypothetical protein DAPPUDRAFT_328102 [Daphnia pulex]|uniref:Uncharacterized protein n=1 Tax=Daphnia pulex TaxID=6669 RepID=E9HCI3_DAPPU|nr:hypothetical protein DAPPUDRAFT_328102 [Daphnia pulex]|eukprot:EFX70527.1 hypothetical protein DAPPUDRAFT_328102 [Daphnia pulex]
MSIILVILVISSSLNVAKSEGSDQPTSVEEEGLYKNSVSTVSERSRLSFKNQRIKCVQYLQSNLNEFMQTVDAPSNKNSTKNPSIAVEEILHKKVLQLMGECTGTEIHVNQHVITEIDSQKRSFEQLVLQKILLKVGGTIVPNFLLDPVGSSAKSHDSEKFENEEEQVNET